MQGTVDQFVDTGRQVRICTGELRPVLRLGDRLFVGETLSVVNPHGFGGRVWSAMDEDTLLFNANQESRAWDRSLT